MIFLKLDGSERNKLCFKSSDESQASHFNALKYSIGCNTPETSERLITRQRQGYKTKYSVSIFI